MTGLILADPEVVRLMDGEVEGDSDLVLVHIKRTGDWRPFGCLASERLSCCGFTCAINWHRQAARSERG